ncbi:MAG: hypothetical protein H6518_12395 [Microthrixaceae bacterium]|nr:hypothetical protein [Microthrixaceae bacterium]
MDLTTHAYRSQIRLLLGTALVMFVFTVVIGILNGTDLVDFDREVLLTHVHVGTLAWITLSVFAATLWLFADGPLTGAADGWARTGSWLAAGTVVVYNLTFLTTDGYLRPVVGTVAALTILGWFAWAVVRARAAAGGVSVPMWGLLAALATSVTGGVIGVLYGILIASRGDAKVLPDGGEDAHPATMVVGFLVPVGMAVVETWLRPDEARTRASRAGFWQMALLFLGGFTLMLGVLLDAVPLITLNLPFEIIAVGIFLKRNWASLRSVGWSAERPTPFLAASSVALVWNLGMLVYLISKYADDFDLAPTRLLLALDHMMFVGVLTNALFAQLLAATATRAHVAAWADRVVFWAVNVGLVGFWFGLVLDEAWPKQVFTPIMGVGILLGVGVFLARLAGDRSTTGAPPAPAAAS